jgi:LacI family transcriptional regulator
MDTLINRLSNIKKKVDGVITFPFTDSYTMFEIFDKCNIPVLTINRSCSESKYNYVAADYFEGSKLVGTLFSEIKCKKIWFISTQVSGVFSKEQRYKGLLEGLQMSGCDADVKVMVADTATDSEGYDIVKRALAEETPPDGIYCSGDYLALGAMNALKEKSISVGKQKGTSVVGSSGFELSANSQPPLSVVQIPMIEMGRKAIRKMLSLRETPDRREAGAMLPTELILRESTPKYLCEQGWLDKILNNYTQAHL